MANKDWRVPEFEACALQEKSSRYCVCVFVINEGERFLHQLQRMRPLAGSLDIVIADGGSSDGSTALDTLRELGVNTLLTKTGKGRLGAQMRMAFAWAIERGYEGVVCVDGNDKDSVEDVSRFTRCLDEGHDHIQGSRFVLGGSHENTPWSRLVGLKVLHVPMMRCASGFRYTDTTNGFRAYSARLLADPRIEVFRDVFDGYELHYYLAIRAPRLGFRCSEVPVTRSYPKTGKVPTKIGPIAGNLQVLHKLLCACFGRYHPKA